MAASSMSSPVEKLPLRTFSEHGNDSGKINRILIANRGEIACRIIDTCKKLNIISIAVFPDQYVSVKMKTIGIKISERY
jgi:hypothetical protein